MCALSLNSPKPTFPRPAIFLSTVWCRRDWSNPAVSSKNQPVFVLCRTGVRAKKAAEILTREGFSEATVVEGGRLAWGDAGLPLERGRISMVSLERQVRIAAGSLVLIGLILGYFVTPWFIALSAFVGAGLVFAGITDYCGMGLLLAKLPWNTRQSA